MRPPRSARTWAALVAVIRPDRFAEGAATGPPKARRSALASGWAGTRIATVERPAVARSERPLSMRRRSTRVSGPGQNVVANRRAASGRWASASAPARSGTWMISGLNAGRPWPRRSRRRRGIARIGPEAVDRLGREGDQFARMQQMGSGAQAALAVREGDGVVLGQGGRLRLSWRNRCDDAASRLSCCGAGTRVHSVGKALPYNRNGREPEAAIAPVRSRSGGRPT